MNQFWSVRSKVQWNYWTGPLVQFKVHQIPCWTWPNLTKTSPAHWVISLMAQSQGTLQDVSKAKKLKALWSPQGIVEPWGGSHFPWLSHWAPVSSNAWLIQKFNHLSSNQFYIPFPCERGGQNKGQWNVLKQNIVRCYSDLKPNVPTRNCIGSLRSKDLCKWYHTNCGLVMCSSQSY